MTIAVAKAVVMSGPGGFGIAYPLLDEAERDELRLWFVRSADVRPRAEPESVRVRPAVGGPTYPALVPSSTGELCPGCGGLMVRTGTCLTCQSCGNSSGGCS